MRSRSPAKGREALLPASELPRSRAEVNGTPGGTQPARGYTARPRWNSHPSGGIAESAHGGRLAPTRRRPGVRAAQRPTKKRIAKCGWRNYGIR
jgi:hypothetical protein